MAEGAGCFLENGAFEGDGLFARVGRREAAFECLKPVSAWIHEDIS